jgi:hypothetical protein
VTLRRALPALADLTPIDNHVVGVGPAVDLDGAEGEVFDSHLILAFKLLVRLDDRHRRVQTDGQGLDRPRTRIQHALFRGPWRVLLEQSEDGSPPQSVLELELTVAPLSADSSRLSVEGMFSPTLFRRREGGVGQAVTRRVANEHARALLEQMATILEAGAQLDKRSKPAASAPHSVPDAQVRAAGPRTPRTRRP